MASSVSSERAFSQGGITISKRRNWLKGDIVEALQCIKCAIRHDLLFRKPGPSSVGEEHDECENEANPNEKPMLRFFQVITRPILYYICSLFTSSLFAPRTF